MDYQQMLNDLVEMESEERRRTIVERWDTVFSDGFIGFVQGQIDAGRQTVAGDGPLGGILEGAIGDLIRESTAVWLAQVFVVWGHMKDVYAQVTSASRDHGPTGGMADVAGARREMPRGVSVTPAATCFRCGSEVASGGLCAGCLAEQDAAERDHVEYDRQLHDQQLDRQDYQRLQDDQTYYDTQQDFSYTPSHDDGGY